MRLITSIDNEPMKGDIQPVNTMNCGASASIPYRLAVELSCIITKEGTSQTRLVNCHCQ
ncbi:hypothetical protein [Mesobacillus foraminis]|uniref:hypothetical protein n=1 Tax=Mesobacillus foraminis TaxID=279826 RepID=UPI00359CB9AE